MLEVAEKMEARVGIEPTHKGFADLSLTAWVPRHLEQLYRPAGLKPVRQICDFPIIPVCCARKDRDSHLIASATTTFSLNP
jgi:hypothetical protein